MSWFKNITPGLEEPAPKPAAVNPEETEPLAAIEEDSRNPNVYHFGKRFFAEWSEEENVEPWVIYDGSRGCKRVFCTDTKEHAERIITFLDQAPPA